MTPVVEPSATVTLAVEDGSVLITPGHWQPEMTELIATYEGTGWTTHAVAYNADHQQIFPAVDWEHWPDGSWDVHYASYTGIVSNRPMSLRIERTIAGMTIGQTYRITVEVQGQSASINATQRVGAGGSVVEVPNSDAREQVTVEWTATATSTLLYIDLERPSYGGMQILFREMTLWRWAPAGWVDPVYSTSELTLPAVEGSVVLDASRWPYITANCEIAITSPALVEQIDPRTSPRVVLNATEAHAPTTRTFDLALRNRTVNHEAGTISLELASDEALLGDYSPLTPDKSARIYEGSLSAVVRHVLGIVIPSCTLISSPAADAYDVTARWTLTNMVQNPEATNNLDGFTAASNTSAIARLTTGGYNSATRVQWTSAAAGWSGLGVGRWGVRQGSTYLMTCMVEAAVGRQVRLVAHWLDGDDRTIRYFTGTPVAGQGGGNWVRLAFLARPPVGAATMGFKVEQNTPGGGLSSSADAFLFAEVDEDVAYFNGNHSDGEYVYVWEDAPNQSQSTRIPLVERRPELFTWQPGTSAWEFLETFLAESGFRLWCDADRVWHLDDTPTGTFTVTAGTTITGTDEVSRDDDTWADGVVIIYRYVDATTGLEVEKRDTAGSSGRVAVVERQRPYPGPGAAASILAAMQGKGRAQRVETFTDYTIEPGYSVDITLPGTEPQTGTLSAVEFNLTAGTMTIRAANLEPTP